MYIVTGGAGFLGSSIVWKLNELGEDEILVVDNLGESTKWKNLVNRRFAEYLHKDTFMDMLLHGEAPWKPKAVFHMGACSATTERNVEYLWENNTRYSQTLCAWTLEHGGRFINASSAATYGDGEAGFDDDPTQLESFKPLNPYAFSKQRFDLWAQREGLLDSIVSLKFFNVFGPNEYHKDTMRSMVCKAFEQIRNTGELKLFRSYREAYEDGGQMRDFVWVKDCVEVVRWLAENPAVNGVFNVGSGKARTWNDLARAVFSAMEAPERIEYIPMPEVLQGAYQYYTQAPMERLAAVGAPMPSTTLEDAVEEYVRGYLAQRDPYL